MHTLRSLHAALWAVSCVALATPARAHDVALQLTPRGLAFLEAHLPDAIPDSIAVPDQRFALFDCGDRGEASVTQRDTTIGIDVRQVSLEQPRDGVLRVEVDFDARLDGVAELDLIYACRGHDRCREAVTVTRATASIDLVAGEGAALEVRGAELDLAPEDLQVRVSECRLDDDVDLIVDLIRDLAFERLVAEIEGLAADRLAPLLSGLLGSFARVDLETPFFTVDGEVTSLVLSRGLGVRGEVDLWSAEPRDLCFPATGEPRPHAGPVPDLTSSEAHVAASANLGLIDDALYQVWGAALRCTGLGTDGAPLSRYLTAFPAGTSFGARVLLGPAPTVVGRLGDGATLAIQIEGVEVALFAETPDGRVVRAVATLAAQLTTRLFVDPETHSLALELADVGVLDLAFGDDAPAEMDAGAVRRFLEAELLPETFETMLGSVMRLPLAVGVGGYFGVLRDVRTTETHLVVEADLFRAPDDDRAPPRTRVVAAPSGRVAPDDARVLVAGDDDEVPSALLRYRVVVNGFEQPTRANPEIEVGHRGASGAYVVEVAAIDPAGNVDPTPEVVTVTVDGTAPVVTIDDVTPSRLALTAIDDQPEPLAARVDVVALTLEGERPVRAWDVALSGARHDEPIDRLEPGLYRVTVTVADAVGNSSVAATDLLVGSGPGSAPPTAAAGGCHAGGPAPTPPSTLLLLVLALGWTRRRR